MGGLIILMTSRRVLVTGSNGFIGKIMVRYLVERGYDVIGLDTASGELEPDRRIYARVVDITDKAVLKEVVENVDIVFHLAARFYGDKDSIRRVTVLGTKNLVDRCIDSGVKCFLFSSSASVYGDHGGRFVDESSECRPTSAYGRSKLEAERILLEAHKELGFPAVILRLVGVYGPGGYILKPYLEGRGRRFYLIGGGENWTGFVHVDDVARAFEIAATKRPTGETFIVTDDVPATIREFYNFVSEQLGLPPPRHIQTSIARIYSEAMQIYNKITGRTVFTTPDTVRISTQSNRFSNAKIKRELGFKPLYPTYIQGVQQVLRQYHDLFSTVR